MRTSHAVQDCGDRGRGQGQINLSVPGTRCGPYAPAEVGPYEVTITGGSGAYAGASGTLQFRSSVYTGGASCSCGNGRDTWTGTLSVPGHDFDLTPPVFGVAVSKTVRAPKRAKRVRVRYAAKATDAADGSVPAACAPRSGSFFKFGRTKVRCSATDSSGNTARIGFTVTVKRFR